MSRGIRFISRSKKRLTLFGALVVMAVSAVVAIAYFTSHGAGTGAASTGSLTAPTLNTPTPGAGTVALSWSTVTPPSGSVTYFVTRDGGNAGGNCPTSGSPTGVISCTDSGLAAGTYHYTVTVKWHSWTATSNQQTVAVASGAATKIVLSGTTGDLTSGATRTFTATIEDAAGNPVTTGADSSAAVSFSQTAGAGSVSFATPTATSGGVATDVVTGVLAGSVTIRATATLAGPGSTNSNTLTFTVVHGAASQISLAGATTDLASGTTRAFTATIEDAAGNTVNDGADSSVSVSFAQTGGAGSVTGTGSATAAGGVATKSLTGNLAGSVTIRASATLSGPGSTNSNPLTFNVVAGTATKLVFTTQPVGGVAEGVDFATQPTVSVEDANGNVVTGDFENVTLEINTGPGSGVLSCSNTGFPTVAASSGVVGFTHCQITGTAAAGTYTLKATRSGLTQDISNSVVINVGSATKLAFTTQPVGGVAEGVDLGTQPVVSVEDSFSNVVTTDSGNVTLAINTGPGSGVLSCSNTGFPTVAASSGVVGFTHCQITGTAAAGTYTLKATRSGLTQDISNNVVINVGSASKLVFTSTALSGQASSSASLGPATVQRQDSFSNPTTSGTTTVDLSSNSAGTAIFSSSLNGSSATSVQITAGNSTVNFFYGDTKAATPTITAADHAAVLTQATQQQTITAADLNKVVFTTSALSGQASSSASLGPATLQRQDQFGNPVTSSSTTVNLSSNSSGTAVFSAAQNGATTTSLTITAGNSTVNFFYGDTKAGSPTVTANAGAGALTATQQETITAGAVKKLVFTTSAVSGQASTSATLGPVTVQEQDQFGNPVTAGGAGVVVSLSSTSTGAKFAATSGGTAVTSVTIPNGSSSVNFFYGDTKSGTPTITGHNAGIANDATQQEMITAGAATNLVLTATSTTPTAGAADSLTITAQDANNNTATSYTGDKSLTFTGASTIGTFTPTVTNKTGTAVNFGTAETITFTNGVATVSGANNGVMTLYKAETANIGVSDGTINNGAGLSVTVSAASPSAFKFTNCTVNGGANQAICPASVTGLGNNQSVVAHVSVFDSFGNTATVTGSALNVTLNDSNTTRFPISTPTVQIATGASESGTFSVMHNRGTSTDSTTVSTTNAGFTQATINISG